MSCGITDVEVSMVLMHRNEPGVQYIHWAKGPIFLLLLHNAHSALLILLHPCMLKAGCFWKKKKDGCFLLFFGQAVLKYTAVSKAPGEIQAEISFSIYLTIGGK